MIKAVFFDLDDTLCTYWDASKRALRETFEKHWPENHTPDQMVAEWAAAFRSFLPEIKTPAWYDTYLKSGETTRTEQMRRTLLRLEKEDPALAAQLSTTYGNLRNQYLELFPEAKEVLDKFRGRVPLGLITNGPADIQRQEIDTLGISDYFDHVFIEGEQGIGKPEPEVFKRAERAVGLPPSDLLFVGNSYLHDILPAIQAGWKTAWIRKVTDVPPSSNGKTSKPEEQPANTPPPDLTTADLRDIFPLVFQD